MARSHRSIKKRAIGKFLDESRFSKSRAPGLVDVAGAGTSTPPGGLTQGASAISTTEARKPRLRRILDGFPPDTRIVVAGVTWGDYQNLLEQIGEARNCRIAFDGNDIEMTTSTYTPIPTWRSRSIFRRPRSTGQECTPHFKYLNSGERAICRCRSST
jgi:hypothetical protein